LLALLAVSRRPFLLLALHGDQPGVGSVVFQQRAVGALDSLQGPGNVVELVNVLGLQLGAALEVHLRLVLAAQSQIAQAAEVKAAWIAAAGVDGRTEVVVGLLVVLCEVGVNADPVTLSQGRVLGDNWRDANED
jgi:hypothetical protein